MRLNLDGLSASGGAYAHNAGLTWDSAGRRNGLNMGAFAYSYSWRADGLLASALGVTGGGTYTYTDAGLRAD